MLNMRKWMSVVALAALLGLAALPTQAAEFLGPSQKAGDINVSAGQSHRNLYTAGRNVNINSEVQGDLYAAGASVNLNGKVEADLNAAGGTVVLNSEVGQDARVAGGSVNINAPVGGDLLLAGGNVNISSSSSVGGDLAGATGTLTLDAPVNGALRVAGGTIRINSEVKGNLEVESSDTLTFGPQAIVKGTITYRGVKNAIVEDGAQVASINFTKIESKGGGMRQLAAAGVFVQLVALFIVGWLFVYFRRQGVESVMHSASHTPLPNLLIGLLALIATPILAVLLFVSIVGYYIGMLLLVSFILILLVSYVLAAVYLGGIIMQLIKRTSEIHLDWVAVLVGVVAFTILSWIPILGWLVKAILMLIVLGTMVKHIRPKHEKTLVEIDPVTV